MRSGLLTIAILILLGCATKPVLSEKDSEAYCNPPGACEAYLRSKMMQYQQLGVMGGGVVVGVMPAPKAGE